MAAFAVASVAASCTLALALWNGRGVLDRSYEQLLQDVDRPAGQEAAIGALREKLLAGLRKIRQHEDDDGRPGLVARNALEHLRKELER